MATVPSRASVVKPERPLTRPVRTAERVELRSGGSGPLYLLIGAGRENKSYFLTPAESDFGRAFRLESRAEDKVYHVCLDGPNTCCSCDGFLWTGGCKHASALLGLVARGSL